MQFVSRATTSAEAESLMWTAHWSVKCALQMVDVSTIDASANVANNGALEQNVLILIVCTFKKFFYLKKKSQNLEAKVLSLKMLIFSTRWYPTAS